MPLGTAGCERGGLLAQFVRVRTLQLARQPKSAAAHKQGNHNRPDQVDEKRITHAFSFPSTLCAARWSAAPTPIHTTDQADGRALISGATNPPITKASAVLLMAVARSLIRSLCTSMIMLRGRQRPGFAPPRRAAQSSSHPLRVLYSRSSGDEGGTKSNAHQHPPT
jgi:hypothetical protein